MPQITLDTTALENTFDTVGQSMLQLARAQDQTNRQLQQHLQQGQLNMQAHTGALQQLAMSTYQCHFDHIFASIPIYDGSDREGFLPWLECLEAACFYSGRNIKTEGTLPFLDILIKPDQEGRLHTTVYRKPTHTDQYLHWDSLHPISSKYSVVGTLHHRARTICSNHQIAKRRRRTPNQGSDEM